MRVLITGGGGFIGSSLANSLLEDGHDVTVVDNFFTGRAENLRGLNAPLISLDLADPENIGIMDRFLENVDVVYHLAASIGVKLVQEKPKETFRNSTQINDNLFPLFEKHNVKVIFSSTSEVYGETKSEDGSKETDHLEIHPVQKPRGSYACAKLFSEFMIRSYNFPSVIVRFFNIVGPNQVKDYGHVLPKFIESAVKGEDLTVYGDGKMVRSFCDIRDAIPMLKLLLKDEHSGEVYNVGNDSTAVTMNQLANGVIKVVQSSSNIVHVPFEEALGKQFEEIFIRYPNTDKMKQYYKCKYSMEDIIRNIYETNFGGSSAS